MAVYIDNAMLRALKTFPHRYFEDKKIALIGEKRRGFSKGSMAWKMANKLNYIDPNNITVFTVNEPFKLEDGEHFDLLVGVRACEAEKVILEAATKYRKNFIIMPCVCGRLQIKIVRYIRDWPVIDRIDSFPGRFPDGTYDNNAWIVLYNILKEEHYA